MMKLEDLEGRLTQFNGQTYIDLASAKSIDKYTGRILQVASDFCKLDKVTELTTVTNVLTYANGRKEKETYYFIRVDECLRLVSEQAYNAIEPAFMKNKTIVKGDTIPGNSNIGDNYINMFYIDTEEY